MKKINYLLSIMVASIAFVGCGGGGSDSQTITNNVYSYKDYENRPDMPNKTQTQNIQPNSSNLSTTNYQSSSYQNQAPTNSYQPSSSSRSVRDILKDRYKDSFYDMAYTYYKGGIFLQLTKRSGYELHLLDAKTLKDEKTIYFSDEGALYNITGLKGGLVKFTTNGKEIVYDYLNDSSIQPNSRPDNSTMHNNINVDQMVINSIKNYIQNNYSNSYLYRVKKQMELSNNRYAVLAEVSNMDLHYFIFVVWIDSQTHTVCYKVASTNAETGGKLQIKSVDRGSHILYYRDSFVDEYVDFGYNYISNSIVYKDDSHTQTNDTYSNNNGAYYPSSNGGGYSDNSSVTSTIANQLQEYITHVYSQQGGGIFVVGRKNGRYSFYRFDANSLKLEQAFYNIPINPNSYINNIRALSNGNFEIQTDMGDYIFNYFDGSFH